MVINNGFIWFQNQALFLYLFIAIKLTRVQVQYVLYTMSPSSEIVLFVKSCSFDERDIVFYTLCMTVTFKVFELKWVGISWIIIIIIVFYMIEYLIRYVSSNEMFVLFWNVVLTMVYHRNDDLNLPKNEYLPSNSLRDTWLIC